MISTLGMHPGFGGAHGMPVGASGGCGTVELSEPGIDDLHRTRVFLPLLDGWCDDAHPKSVGTPTSQDLCFATLLQLTMYLIAPLLRRGNDVTVQPLCSLLIIVAPGLLGRFLCLGLLKDAIRTLGRVAALRAGLASRHLDHRIDLDGDDRVGAGRDTIVWQVGATDLQLVDCPGLATHRRRDDGTNGSGVMVVIWSRLGDGDSGHLLDVRPAFAVGTAYDLADSGVLPVLDRLPPWPVGLATRIVQQADDCSGSCFAGVDATCRAVLVTQHHHIHRPRVGFVFGFRRSAHRPPLYAGLQLAWPRARGRGGRRCCPSATLESMRNIIWDMGGTLIDTYPQVARTLASCVNDHVDASRSPGGSVPDHVTTEAVTELTMVSIDHAIQTLATRHQMDVGVLKQAYADLKERWRRQPAPVMPGARAIMAQVHDSGGLNLVATHRDRTSAQSLFTAVDMRADDLVCAPDGVDRKPSPAMNLLLLGRHGLRPDEVLCVGDRQIDVDAAHAADCPAALLDPTGALSTDAEYHIESLAQLSGLIG